MAQLSTTISHAHKATAFHFLTSNFFFSSAAPSELLAFIDLEESFVFAGPEVAASCISTSAISVGGGVVFD
jgi:hypothetical protein